MNCDAYKEGYEPLTWGTDISVGESTAAPRSDRQAPGSASELFPKQHSDRGLTHARRTRKYAQRNGHAMFFGAGLAQREDHIASGRTGNEEAVVSLYQVRVYDSWDVDECGGF